jgi:putative membrane protein
MRLTTLLLIAILVIAAASGMAPTSREDWVLENVLALLGILILVCTHKRMPLSNVSYGMIFVFLVLHEVGAHYTYSEVPYDAWFENWTGQSLSARWGLERNHYDRLVHFSYGLLLAYPFREVFVRVADVRGFWGYFLPLDLVMSSSMLYELIEWGAAVNMSEGLGQAYLGTQGDIWDAHKDMLLASVGALLTVLITAGLHLGTRRDFQQEFADSLAVKDGRPLTDGRDRGDGPAMTPGAQ